VRLDPKTRKLQDEKQPFKTVRIGRLWAINLPCHHSLGTIWGQTESSKTHTKVSIVLIIPSCGTCRWYASWCVRVRAA
jgi:hypothetical protein